MPTLQKLFYLEITSEKFIDNCSAVELQEVILLANEKLSRLIPETLAAPAEAVVLKPLPPSLRAKRSNLPTATVPIVSGSKRKWTSDEEATLRLLWPSTPGKKIAKKLGRPYKSVMTRASKLGLSKNKKREAKTRQQPPPELEPELETAPAVPIVPKKLISVRVDKRTIVQVPAGTDVEKIKNKYKNENN
jgi:hypothetical protein